MALVLAMVRWLKVVGCEPPMLWAAAPSKSTVPLPGVKVPELFQFPLTVRLPVGAESVPVAAILTWVKSESAAGAKIPWVTVRSFTVTALVLLSVPALLFTVRVVNTVAPLIV